VEGTFTDFGIEESVVDAANRLKERYYLKQGYVKCMLWEKKSSVS
jgi:hypothetical protein